MLASMILGIESSCDESAVACFDPHAGMVFECVASQVSLHAAYGGVVPDLASREHLGGFDPLFRALREQVDPNRFSSVAVTRGPGLAACLAMGIVAAQAISEALGIPLFGVNHLRAHAYSPFISIHSSDPKGFLKQLGLLLPHLGLIVSGGNTLLVAIREDLGIELLAGTVDDAAGEAIDKGAKLLGLPYPGGPEVEKLATGGRGGLFEFPVSFPNPTDRRFSFSGLKTSLRYTVEKLSDEELQQLMPDLCKDYQQAVVDQLIRKTEHVLREEDFRSLGLSGGVSNNQTLRKRFEMLGKGHGLPALLAERRHTGDNASMIGFTAWLAPHLCQQKGLEEGLMLAPSLPITG